MLPLCVEWERFREAITDDPFGFAGFARADRFYGWLEGYAAFCRQFEDEETASDIEWLVFVAIQLAQVIREAEMKASRDKLIAAAKEEA